MNEGQSSLDHVSVVMPAYNAEKYISEAITSVMNQGHRDWDLIIIDDGSSDRTFELDHGLRFWIAMTCGGERSCQVN